MKTSQLIIWIVLVLLILFAINFSLDKTIVNDPEQGCPGRVEGNVNASFTIKYIYSPSCHYCQEQSPILDSLVEKYGDNFKLEYYNIGECLEISDYYGVRATPYFIFHIDKEGEPDEIEHPGFIEQELLEGAVCEVTNCTEEEI